MAKFKVVTVKDKGGQELHNMMDVDGLRLSNFGLPSEEVADIVHNLINMTIREDDLFLCSAPKSGTHWVFEIVSMLLNGTAETIPYSKGSLMVEVIPQTDLDQLPSPRVLNSHLPLKMLPKDLKEKKTKILLTLRNPKDVAVSYHHHHTGLQMFDYDGKFEDYLPMFVAGEVDYGDWFSYVLEMERLKEKGEYNIHLIFYEDLKENCLSEIRKIARFLDVPENELLYENIAEKCKFENMAKDKAETQEDEFKGNYSFFRKGEIGDWKNYFTVAMSETFDNLFAERMKNSKLKFRFELKDK